MTLVEELAMNQRRSNRGGSSLLRRCTPRNNEKPEKACCKDIAKKRHYKETNPACKFYTGGSIKTTGHDPKSCPV
jgi:hypothetical protein